MNYPLRPAALDHADDTSASDDICLANARLVLPDQVLAGSITIEQGVITAIIEGDHVPSGSLGCGKSVDKGRKDKSLQYREKQR